ncbi:MAG: hypothetical protein K2W82_13190 [Candidatus Obscuribacterales bacterium]|jgi:hypothetical protein|nr:hypothetical protein [Candidatus Obscuribacterales bacterium]
MNEEADNKKQTTDAIVEKDDHQDNFLEAREPVELIFCIIIAAAYAGLAKFCWGPLVAAGSPQALIDAEGIYITIALLALLIGARPYISPSNLQISKHGIKYQGALFWTQRKTVNWTQIVRMYVSPDLILILYRLPNKPKSIRPLFMHTVYLADRDRISDSILKYSLVEPVFLANPAWPTRLFGYVLLGMVIFWIIRMLIS